MRTIAMDNDEAGHAFVTSVIDDAFTAGLAAVAAQQAAADEYEDGECNALVLFAAAEFYDRLTKASDEERMAICRDYMQRIYNEIVAEGEDEEDEEVAPRMN